jgi:uncharacterized protein (DUF362 family)
MNPSKVAVVKTSPQTVLDDVGTLMRLADYRQCLDVNKEVLLKINITWQKYFPGCSTTPWQLEGVIQTLLTDGFSVEQLVLVHNDTVVVKARTGEVKNRLAPVGRKYGLRTIYLQDGVEWVTYTPKHPMMVLDQVYRRGIEIPACFIGNNIIHLPTMKTHVFTTMTGAMKNAFGGLLQTHRHWTHSVIHETLVDLLTIQKEIHSGIFAVTDGTIAGDGPGPRAMLPSVRNYLLASGDQVAVDAVSARMMGFDPQSLDCIRLAHEKGLGSGSFPEIEVVGEDVSAVNFGFRCTETFASRGQKAIYHGWLKSLEKVLLRSPIAFWSYLASIVYHDWYWYTFVGRKRVRRMMETEWGTLFQTYEE